MRVEHKSKQSGTAPESNLNEYPAQTLWAKISNGWRKRIKKVKVTWVLADWQGQIYLTHPRNRTYVSHIRANDGIGRQR